MIRPEDINLLVITIKKVINLGGVKKISVKNQRIIIDGKNQLKSINYRGYSHKF